MIRNNWRKFFIALLLPQAAGALAGLVTVRSVSEWYQHLNKPAFTPPAGVFGPVWGVLYLMMGMASFLVWMGEKGTSLFRFYLIHLFFNFFWSILFFGLRSPFLAFLDIIVLWLMVGGMVFLFWKSSRWASVLLVPYWCWVSFAAGLNYAIWRMN